jgi:hypothetical protein
MPCPDEFVQAQFADKELAETEARELIAHLEGCEACRKRVAALKAENLLLVQSLQGIDLWEPEEAAARPQIPGLARTGLSAAVFVGAAFLLRMGLGLVLRFETPPGLNWLFPLSLSGQLNWLANGFFYIIEKGGSMITSLAGEVGFTVLSLLILGALFAVTRHARGITTIVGLTALMFAFVMPGYAIDIRKAEQRRGGVTVASNETIDDTLVVFADSVNVSGTITGDLIVFARQVNIRGTVQGNVIGFGQRVDVTGKVGGDIFGFGQSVQAAGPVGRSFWGFGQTVTVGTGGRMEQDATLFGANLNVDGDIGRDLTAFAGSLDVGSKIGRDLRFRGGQLLVHAPSMIGRNLDARTKSEKDVQMDPGVTVEGKKMVELVKPQPSQYRTLGFYVRQLLRIGAAFLMGLLLFWLVPGAGRTSLSSARVLLTSGGIGFLAAVAMPVAALILAVTLIGLPIALVTFMFWLLGLYLAKIVIARCIGGAILGTSGDGMASTALALLIGLVVVIAAVNLPFIGGILNFLLILIGLGALVLTIWQMSGSRPNAA